MPSMNLYSKEQVDALLSSKVIHTTTVTVPAAGGVVTVTGMTSTAVVWTTPNPSSYNVWLECNCRCIAQGTNSLTFTVDSTASTTIDMDIAWLE